MALSNNKIQENELGCVLLLNSVKACSLGNTLNEVSNAWAVGLEIIVKLNCAGVFDDIGHNIIPQK